jgi:UDP-2,3-diacylglucosamine hydrolase
VLDALAAAGQRVWLGWMHGNRDFLFGSQARARAGLHLLPDPTVLQAFGTRLLLSHGDALCLADEDYQRFRLLVRSQPWQAAFLAQPLIERERQARHIRQESRSRQSRVAEAGGWADVDADQSRAWLSRARAQTLVHGHTHRPGQHVLQAISEWGRSEPIPIPPHGAVQRWVLTDWDLDAGAAESRSGVLRWSACGLERVPPQGTVAAGRSTRQESLVRIPSP